MHNLGRYVRIAGFKTLIVRNDQITLAEMIAINPSYLIISPGPYSPNEAGVSLDAIAYFGTKIPILGICLGHQAIAQNFGATIVKAQYPMHGKASKLKLAAPSVIFNQLKNPITVGRYHSLIVKIGQSNSLIVTAWSLENEIMALEHVDYPIYGLQFHPESLLTPQGAKILKNFFLVS